MSSATHSSSVTTKSPAISLCTTLRPSPTSQTSQKDHRHNGRQAHHWYAPTTPRRGSRYRSRIRLRHGQLLLVRIPHAPNQRPRRLLHQARARASRQQGRVKEPERSIANSIDGGGGRGTLDD